jgi:hypothetical protein
LRTIIIATQMDVLPHQNIAILFERVVNDEELVIIQKLKLVCLLMSQAMPLRKSNPLHAWKEDCFNCFGLSK